MSKRLPHLFQPIRPGVEFKSRVVSQECQDNIQHLNVREALRLKKCIYEALIGELYEDGCKRTAKYFQCLRDKEDELLEASLINKRVKADETLLLTLYDTAKAAEQTSKLEHCERSLICYKLLFEILRSTKTFSSEYHWLENKLFYIIVKIADRYDVENIVNNEMRAKIYCFYAIFASPFDTRFEEASEYFNKALCLCRGQEWRSCDITDVYDEYYLHELTTLRFAQMLTKYGRAHLHMNPINGIALANKAILCVAEISQLNMVVLLLDAMLIKARFLMETNNIKAALKQLSIANRHMRGNHTPEVLFYRCEELIHKSKCFNRLGRPETALVRLKQAYAIGRNIGAKKHVGIILLDMAKIYIFNIKNDDLAYQTLIEARQIFRELNDGENKKRTTYIMAKFESQIFKEILFNIIKRSDYQFRAKYILRKWKFLNEAFWDRNRRVSLQAEPSEYFDADGVNLTDKRLLKFLPSMTSTFDNWNLAQNQMEAKNLLSTSDSSDVSSDSIKLLMREGQLIQVDKSKSSVINDASSSKSSSDNEDNHEQYSATV